MPVEKTAARASKQHTVYKDCMGARVPSVSTIKGVIAKDYLIKWANDLGLEGIVYGDYMKEVANTGTCIHELIQAYLGGTEVREYMFSQGQLQIAYQAFDRFTEWAREYKMEFISSEIELPLVHDELQYGGTIDWLGHVNGVLTLMDIKTSSKVNEEHIIQLSAYHELLRYHGKLPERVFILRIGREDGIEFRQLTHKELVNGFHIFKRCLELYSALREFRRKGDRIA